MLYLFKIMINSTHFIHSTRLFIVRLSFICLSCIEGIIGPPTDKYEIIIYKNGEIPSIEDSSFIFLSPVLFPPKLTIHTSS